MEYAVYLEIILSDQFIKKLFLGFIKRQTVLNREIPIADTCTSLGWNTRIQCKKMFHWKKKYYVIFERIIGCSHY